MSRKIRVPLDRSFTRFEIIDLDELGGATVGVNLRLPDGRVLDLTALQALAAGQSVDGSIVWGDVGEKPDNITAAAGLSGGGFVSRNGGTGAWSTQDFSTSAPAALAATATPGTSAAPARADHAHALPALDDLTDIAIVSLATGHVLTYNGSQWVNQAPAAASIADDSVTNAKLADMPAGTLKGNSTAAAANPADLDATAVRSLLNVANGATANSSDASLRDRATHTGSQAAATISNFAEAVDDRVGALLVAGANVTLTYNDAAGTLTIAAAAGGGVDPWTYIALSGDFSTSSATAVDIPGLNFAPDVLSRYEVEAVLFTRTATATVGPRPGVGWPLSGVTDGIVDIQQTSAAATNVLQNGNSSAAVLAPVGGVPTTTGSWPARIRAAFTTGATVTGNFRIQLASETAGTNVTAKAGSFIRYREY